MTSSNDFFLLSCEFLSRMLGLALMVSLELKLTLNIPDSSYYLILRLSDNFRLLEVLPDVPPVVPLNVCLDIRLEALTSSVPTLCLCWRVVKTKFIV